MSYEVDISRRSLVKGMATVGLSATLPAQLSMSSAKASQGIRGGHLKAAFTQTDLKESLDPLRATTTMDQARLMQLYDRLIDYRPDYSLAPRLAETWESDPEAKIWRFHLRKGVTFHDGKSFTSDDAVYSIRKHLGGKDSGSVIAPYFDTVVAVDSEGSSVMRIELSRPNVDFPTYLSDPRAVMMPTGTTDFAAGIGTGPFKLSEFNPGIRSIFARYENYWKENTPFVDSVELFGISDVVARTNALLSGEVHLAQQIDPKTVDIIDASGRARVFRAPSGSHYYFAAMCDRAPTDNLNLRLALKYLVDRKRMLKTVSRGMGQLGNDHPVPPSNPWYNDDIPLREYDPERAAYHLKKGGIDNLTLQLHTANAGSPVANDAALMYQQMVNTANLGLKIDVIQSPIDGYWSNIWQHKPFVTSGWTPVPTVDIMFTQWYSSGSPWNDTAWKNDRFDQLLLQARQTFEDTTRREIYNEMQLILHENGGNIIPVFGDLLDGVSTNVDGFVPSPFGFLSNFQFAESVWFKS